jgi:fatty acid desaturase
MPSYLDATQRHELQRLRATWLWRTEWPTWLLIVAIYSGWFGVALDARMLGTPLTLGLLAVLSCWYMSLQHELLHGHPTRHAWLNALFGLAPLAVWFPYATYRDSHLRHHDDEHLTDPERDPESFFVSSARWQRAHPCLRVLLSVRNTLAGRIVVGPWFSISAAVRHAVMASARGEWRVTLAWAVHLAALAVLATWLDQHCGIRWYAFVFGVGYPALALGAVRSFHEHRVAADARERTVINEAALPWRLLFLNNNYHAVHHDLPGVPWFALRTVYHRRRDAYLARNGQYVVQGYGEWFARYALKTVAPALHPLTPHAVPAHASTPRVTPAPAAWNDDSARLAG